MGTGRTLSTGSGRAPAGLPEVPSRPVTRDEYVDRILTGGFPMIL